MSDHYYVRNRYVEACPWSGEAGIGVCLNSGYESHRPHLRFIIGKLWVLFRVPQWVIAPRRVKVQAQTWDAATVARMGRDWYWDETRREFGLDVTLKYLSVHYGVQPDSWPGDKSARWSFPWMEWRYAGQRWYNLEGELCGSVPAKNARGAMDFDAEREVEERVPKARFELEDFDGERIIATTHIEESEYHLGAGWFKWLALLGGRRVHRSMSIKYDKEVGYEKGSWKGGMTGHGIELLPGELHEAAMRRYCAAGVRNKGGISPLKFIGVANVQH